MGWEHYTAERLGYIIRKGEHIITQEDLMHRHQLIRNKCILTLNIYLY